MSDILRNEEPAVLAKALNSQRLRALDVVVPAKALHSDAGLITIKGTEAVVSDDGVTQADGAYEATMVGDEGFATKLSIPSQYLRRLHSEHIGLYDANLNGWLERSEDRYLLRLLRGEGQHGRTGPNDLPLTDGVIRAVLSDRYRTIDNFDVLMATLQGVRDAGADDAIIKADLTERHMHVRITSPTITARASEAVIANYRDPHGSGRTGRSHPLVAAGLRIRNSEVGNGAFGIAPYVTWLVCGNGQTFTEDAMKEIHLGAKLDEGVVRYSARTLRKNLELITSQTADAVGTFLTGAYVQSKLDAMERDMGVQIEEPTTVIAEVSKRLGFSKAEQEDILGAFIKGGQMTAGGVMQAVTATAQVLDDGDAAYEREALAGPALVLAAKAARA